MTATSGTQKPRERGDGFDRAGFDVRPVHNARGGVAGYVWRRRGRTGWGAILEGYCSCCAPEKGLGRFPDLAAAAAAVVAGVKASSRQ